MAGSALRRLMAEYKRT